MLFPLHIENSTLMLIEDRYRAGMTQETIPAHHGRSLQ